MAESFNKHFASIIICACNGCCEGVVRGNAEIVIFWCKGHTPMRGQWNLMESEVIKNNAQEKRIREYAKFKGLDLDDAIFSLREGPPSV
jgi:hypothetical protein